MCWKLNKSRGFKVGGYYRLSCPSNWVHFPWKIIWRSKIPPRAAFFSSAVLGRIFTTDNLWKRDIIVVDWSVMHKRNGENVDHPPLHFPIAHEMWSLVFCLFGIHRVMPLQAMDLLASWQGSFARHRNAASWKIVSHCLMWCIW